MPTLKSYVNWDPAHLELFFMESGAELMLQSRGSRKAALLGGRLNKSDWSVQKSSTPYIYICTILLSFSSIKIINSFLYLISCIATAAA